jgi:beta-mannosidase
LTEDSLIILCATLFDENNHPVARSVNWPEPYRYLQWPKDTAVTVTMGKQLATNGNGASHSAFPEVVEIVANQPVKGFLLYIGYDDGEEADWEDNMLDLMPGEKLTVHANGINGRKILSKWLGSWELNA